MTTVSYGREATVSTRREQRSLLSALRHIDFVLIGAAFALALIGLVMVYTATRNLSGLSPHYYVERQAIWVFIGVIVMVVCASVDYRVIRRFGYIIYGIVILALLGVMAVGTAQLGAERSYQFGPLQLQPSEFAAIGLIIAIANYCSRHQGVLAFREMVGLWMLAGVPMVLVYKQPDLGTTIILGVTLAAMMVAADVRLRYLAMLFVMVVGGFFLAVQLHLLHEYQLERLTAFLHQHSNLSSTNYQLGNTENAISAGGVWGTGIGKGLATNLAFIPFQWTDFIFSAVGEQLGFVGSAVVIGLYGVIVLRMLRAAQMARDTFGRLLCVGGVAFLAFSVFQNIGMNVGIMPITGIPLPFISYGGSASFAFFAMIGLVLNVEMRRLPRR